MNDIKLTKAEAIGRAIAHSIEYGVPVKVVHFHGAPSGQYGVITPRDAIVDPHTVMGVYSGHMVGSWVLACTNHGIKR